MIGCHPYIPTRAERGPRCKIRGPDYV